jgi:hypothetical protein
MPEVIPNPVYWARFSQQRPHRCERKDKPQWLPAYGGSPATMSHFGLNSRWLYLDEKAT